MNDAAVDGNRRCKFLSPIFFTGRSARERIDEALAASLRLAMPQCAPQLPHIVSIEKGLFAPAQLHALYLTDVYYYIPSYHLSRLE